MYAGHGLLFVEYVPLAYLWINDIISLWFYLTISNKSYLVPNSVLSVMGNISWIIDGPLFKNLQPNWKEKKNYNFSIIKYPCYRIKGKKPSPIPVVTGKKVFCSSVLVESKYEKTYEILFKNLFHFRLAIL